MHCKRCIVANKASTDEILAADADRDTLYSGYYRSVKSFLRVSSADLHTAAKTPDGKKPGGDVAKPDNGGDGKDKPGGGKDKPGGKGQGDATITPKK